MASLIGGIFIMHYRGGSLDVATTFFINAVIYGGLFILVLIVSSARKANLNAKSKQTQQRLGMTKSNDGTGRVERPVESPDDW